MKKLKKIIRIVKLTVLAIIWGRAAFRHGVRKGITEGRYAEIHLVHHNTD